MKNNQSFYQRADRSAVGHRNNKDILVSLIVPIFNVEKYLSICLESLVSQTHEKLEIILVDDGSTDSSGRIADQFAERDVRIHVIHQQNAGVSCARNRGLQRAGGEYVMFADPDDWVTEDYVEYLLGLAEESRADVALTIRRFDNYCSEQVREEETWVFSAEECSVYLLCYHMPEAVWCKIYRRSFLQEKQIHFFEDIYIGEGFNFNMLAFQRTDRIVAGNRKVYYYRKDNSASATTRFTVEKAENGMWAMERMRGHFALCTEPVIRAWRFARWRTATDMYDQLVLSGMVKQCPETVRKYKRLSRKGIKWAFTNPVSGKQRIRALVMAVCPELVPAMMRLRKKRYRIAK